MKITDDVRRYAQENGYGDDEVLAVGMEEKSREFAEKGSGIYS